MKDISDLLQIISKLRDPEDGCPWDREQTHASLRPFVIEEAYEVAAAIEDEPEKLHEELGDLLLQVLLHAQIASEDDRFSFTEIVSTLAEKLIRRHPHVFGDETVGSADEVKATWERVKQEEKGKAPSGRLSSLQKGLPGLFESYKIGKKVARDNFDWDTPTEIRAKVSEELQEVDELLADTDASSERLEDELGDLLFTVAQLARKLGVEPEAALKRANRKFQRRFAEMESLSDSPLSNLNSKELESLWQQAKKNTKT